MMLMFSFSGACFGSSNRCLVPEAMKRSGLSSLQPAFNPVATLHSFCASLLRLRSNSTLEDANADIIFVSISRIALALSVHALVTNAFDTMFNLSSLFSPQVLYKVARLDPKLEGAS